DLFIDDDGSIYEDDIDKVGTAGITLGCNPPANDRFCPRDYVDRGQMAAFLSRALSLTQGVGLDLFIDDDGSIYEDDIDKVGYQEITLGCNPPDNDRYCPKDNVTRGEMAAFLHRGLTDIELQLLSFNDYHGHVSGGTAGRIDGERAGGGEYLSTKLTMLRAGHENSLTVAAGDLIGGSPAFSGLFHDEPSVETLNHMDLDVSGVGNHEFDEGVTELLRMQNGGCHPTDGCYFPGTPYPGADFQWLAANTVHETTGETPLPEYEIKNVGSAKVGFIGMTLEGTDALVAAAGIKGWEFKDEVETANALVPTLKGMGVETIIVLLHEGGSQTPPPGDVDACVGISGPIVAINDGLDAEIDAVITGHTHLPYNCMLDDPDGNPRFVASAYSYGRVVTEMNLVIDPRDGEVDRGSSTAVNHAVIQDGLTPDPAVEAIIARWQPLFDEIGLEKVGEISADILRGGTPPGSDRGVESDAGNLVADAQLYATEIVGAQIAFMNPGGVRSDLEYLQSGTEGDGVVTYGEAFTFQPFSNTLVTMEMTGAQIVSVLEEQCQPAGSSRPILHLGVSEGFTYDLDTTVDGVPDCTAVTVSNVELDGVAVTPAGKYMVTMNSFLADGGDNFSTFADVTTERIFGVVDLEALNVYLTDFAPVDPPGTDRVKIL
ncbi:MAG: bifunctional metallophosphatase/5'-nucleotidase, partial [Acidimicrobiia bacterium]